MYIYYKINTSYANYYVMIKPYFDGKEHYGTIHMLKTGVSFIRKYYKKYLNKNKITFCLLKDKSNMDCLRNSHQSLPHYYIIKYGQTWYEKNFECFPHSDMIQKYYKDRKDLRASVLSKPIIDFGLKNKKLAYLYGKYNNFKEFFDFISSNYDCYIYRDWLDRYVNMFIPYLYGMTWCIPFNKNNKIKLTLKKLDEKPKEMFIMNKHEIDIYQQNFGLGFT